MIDGNEGNNEMISHAHEKTREQWLHEGIESFDTKRYHEALAAYEQVIRLDPDFAYAYQKMAQTLVYLGRYAEAGELSAKAHQKQREQDKLPGMWKRVAVPEHFFERMLGFSLPLDHEVVIISYEDISLLDLNMPASIQFDDTYPEGGDIYDRKNQTLTYHGKRFQILGAYGGQPITESQRQEQLVLDLKHENFKIQSKNGSVLFRYWFVDMSGDWGYITFSRDDDFIILGIPYDIIIFHRETEMP
jgi:tetratricopeptide (TPR) repeat protein